LKLPTIFAQDDFRERFGSLRTLGVCGDPWLANLQTYCFADMLKPWLEVSAFDGVLVGLKVPS